MEEVIVCNPELTRRYFTVRKYCGDYAIYEIIKESDKEFERKVCDDIEDKSEADYIAQALTARRSM